MILPDEVCAVLAAPARVGDRLQGFPLVTTGEAGRPRIALLSTAEIDVADGREALLLALAGRRATASFRRGATALLMVVSGDTAHYLTLQPGPSVEHEGVLAVVGTVVDVEADSVGIPLDPLTYEVTAGLVVQERWDRSARALDALRLALEPGQGSR